MKGIIYLRVKYIFLLVLKSKSFVLFINYKLIVILFVNLFDFKPKLKYKHMIAMALHLLFVETYNGFHCKTLIIAEKYYFRQ